MTVEVIEPGRVVRVTAGDESLTADVLEYAEALIEEEGWHKIDPKKPTESSRENGWTLHDSIGEANVRLFSGNKEGPTGASGATVRQEAVAAVQAELPTSQKDDKAFNDAQKTKTTVLAVLRRARGKVAT